ncbi:hypothetical protein AC579_2637 [Pseudocercospora musae]|uniref:Fe2OG dioxygenase domain-containing protein n=1 Tax=Pseudocercospora musae TaxID=113226 RepID=A0A139IGN9_9PEZI|nr:hypothetical protein AC579_2637 [Pseudocercospora musae]
MVATQYTNRSIPRVSLKDFETRIDEITKQLVHAAETDGFFSLTDTEISVPEIDAIFKTSESFFALPDEVKGTIPFSTNNLQFGDNMNDKWIAEAALPGFKADAQAFMKKAQSVSEKLMLCFARGLGFPDNYFIKAHDTSRTDCQSVLRLLHYFEVDKDAPIPENYYRAGAHADWDLITLLFQRPGQSGLEICPGREVVTSFGVGDTWTKVDFAPGDIVCNIGDLLMSWSDDRFKSTFHRVKAPTDLEKDYFGPRYSIAFFNQPCIDCEIQGPLKKYPKVTGAEFTRSAMQRNFAAIKAKQEQAKQDVHSFTGISGPVRV